MGIVISAELYHNLRPDDDVHISYNGMSVEIVLYAYRCKMIKTKKTINYGIKEFIFVFVYRQEFRFLRSKFSLLTIGKNQKVRYLYSDF